MLYEDNATCFAQLEKGFTKSKNTRHISSEIFFTLEQQEQKKYKS